MRAARQRATSELLIMLVGGGDDDLVQEAYTEKADVFSFAIILWELLTRQEPYPGEGKRQGERPRLPTVAAALVRSCLIPRARCPALQEPLAWHWRTPLQHRV